MAIEKYRYRFPLAIEFYKYGFSVWWQQPIVRKPPPPITERDGDNSISIFLSIFDDDES